ncbi:MAG: penicillin-binding protein activator [Candidatus Nezhaarchaeales archaeon]
MKASSKGIGIGVWIAIIIIIAILSAYGGYYSGLHQGFENAKALPPSIEIGVLISNIAGSEDALRGIQLATSMINNSGGVSARNITTIIERTNGDPTLAKSAATNLVNKGIKVLVGVLSSSEVKAILPLLHENNVLLVLVSKEVYDDEVYKDEMVVKFSGSPDSEALAMVNVALSIGTKAAIVAVNDSLGKRVASVISEYYRSRGGHVVYEVLYDLAPANLTNDLMKIREIEPTVSFLVGYLDDARTILSSAYRLGLTTKWVLSSTLASEKLLKDEVAHYLEGSYVLARRMAVEGLQLQSFVDLYNKVYGTMPTEMAAYGFDSLILTALSVAYSGQYSGKSVRAAFNVTGCFFNGVGGRVILDSSGNAIQEYAILEVAKTLEDTYRLKIVGYWIPKGASNALVIWTTNK